MEGICFTTELLGFIDLRAAESTLRETRLYQTTRPLRLPEPELFEDDSAEGIPDLGMSRNRRLASIRGIQPEVVATSVAVQHATLLRQLAQKIASLQAGTSISFRLVPG